MRLAFSGMDFRGHISSTAFESPWLQLYSSTYASQLSSSLSTPLISELAQHPHLRLVSLPDFFTGLVVCSLTVLMSSSSKIRDASFVQALSCSRMSTPRIFSSTFLLASEYPSRLCIVSSPSQSDCSYSSLPLSSRGGSGSEGSGGGEPHSQRSSSSDASYNSANTTASTTIKRSGGPSAAAWAG
ncbi:hypothetical protein B0H13DRAFT_2039230 [Mycena leptocephala]|nr:hypothetical protein B0H13DRAFT_2039230 [Mycena leptocephala]